MNFPPTSPDFASLHAHLLSPKTICSRESHGHCCDLEQQSQGLAQNKVREPWQCHQLTLKPKDLSYCDTHHRHTKRSAKVREVCAFIGFIYQFPTSEQWTTYQDYLSKLHEGQTELHDCPIFARSYPIYAPTVQSAEAP